MALAGAANLSLHAVSWLSGKFLSPRTAFDIVIRVGLLRLQASLELSNSCARSTKSLLALREWNYSRVES